MNDSPSLLPGSPGTLVPPLLLAPMAGITHSAFRRLVADFGGYGGLFTEMLSSMSLLNEDLARSPFTKRRPEEGVVFYQIRIAPDEPVEKTVERLTTIAPSGIDINLGCPAPAIKRQHSGTALFSDLDGLAGLLVRIRRCWSGTLSVKCRLGADEPGWQERFTERMKLFENEGVDFVTVHPRFSGEKLKRRARWNLYGWITSLTSLPVVANGDIPDRATALTLLQSSGCAAAMLGRFAAMRPWVFAEKPAKIDYAEVWERLFRYTGEDFPPEKAIGRLKEFSSYYARNFFYGHEFYRLTQSSRSLTEMRDRALTFLTQAPRPALYPSVDGI